MNHHKSYRPLYIASKLGLFELVQLLLENGATYDRNDFDTDFYRICDHCSEFPVGGYYTCITCSDSLTFDLCTTCYDGSEWEHIVHNTKCYNGSEYKHITIHDSFLYIEKPDWFQTIDRVLEIMLFLDKRNRII